MALQVWLPLNGTLKNQGLDPDYNTPSTNHAAWATNGRLGKPSLYPTTTTSGVISYSKKLQNDHSYTLCAWVKNTDSAATGTRYILWTGSDSNGVGFGMRLAYNVGGRTAYCTVFGKNIQLTIGYNEWHHIAMVVDYENLKFSAYLDGAYIATSAYTQNTVWDSGLNVGWLRPSYYPFGGQISDVRIYDNCLTAEDILDVYNDKAIEALREEASHVTSDKKIFDMASKGFNMVPYNVIQSGSSMYFNGSNSYITYDGIALSGGTFSTWINVPTKPTSQRIIIHDPVSKICVGYLSNSLLLADGNGSHSPYASLPLTYNAWHHLAVTYDVNKHSTALYVDGVAMVSSGNSTVWTNGTQAAIGRRIGAATTDNFLGYLNDLTIYRETLTPDEIKAIHDKGLNTVTTESIHPLWRDMYLEYSGCTWVKILHHDHPSSKIFTAENCEDMDDADLMSKLYLYRDPNRFKMENGLYEFMVREKLTEDGVENIGTWVQASSPSATTLSGYQLLSSGSTNPQRSWGLAYGPTGNTKFSNKGAWWCACGAYKNYQGGIPGFWGVVKTGYLDLYARIDGTKFMETP